MSEPPSPTDRVLQRHPVRRWCSLGPVLILLTALLVLAAAPLSAAGRAPRQGSANPSARIAVQIMSWEGGGEQGQILTVRADGRGGVRQLVPGTHNWLGCQSADGRKMAYYSDQEAPHEYFLYLANADGTHAEKVTETKVSLWCPFSERWLLLGKQSGGWGAMSFIRHDLQTGAEKTVLTSGTRAELSPDGSKLLFVGGLDYTPVRGKIRPKGKETLELLDLTTLERRRLAGPLARTKSFRFECHCLTPGWSPDGRQVAYTVGPPYYPSRVGPVPTRPRAQPYAVYVQPVAGGPARRVLRFSGGPPSISWSVDGRRLLVCAQSRARPFQAFELGCSGGGFGRPGSRGPYLAPAFAGRLLLVDLARHSVRTVASGQKLLFAQWAPSGRSFAYATPAAAYVARPGGVRRLLPPKPNWPSHEWMGWSPDGKYIGLGIGTPSRVAVLNAATGQMRVLAEGHKGKDLIWSWGWWR
jgi:hypothetical protein